MAVTIKHIPLPKETKAFICANCGAVSLSPNDICKFQGKGMKADWCGTTNLKPPSFDATRYTIFDTNVINAAR